MSSTVQVRPVHSELRPNATNSGLMIESVSIKNFRCFASVRAENLGLINVVVGDNASGKTAFLEALYLTATNSPGAHLKFLKWREVIGAELVFSRSTLASGKFWADLFHGRQMEPPISISVKGNPCKELTIERYEESDTVSLAGTMMSAPIRFGWSYDGGDFEYSIPNHNEKDLQFPHAGRAIGGAMITSSVSASELAQRYSDLDLEGRGGEVLSILSAEYPEIVGISSQPDVAVGNLLYAELRGQDRKIALPHVSAGINRLFYILCTIAAYPGGSVYVDEFEAGIYHTHLSAVWSGIYSLAKKQNTQVFLSTHSAEALSALASVIDGREEDYRLVRLRREGGVSDLEVVPGESMAAAIEQNWDVR